MQARGMTKEQLLRRIRNQDKFIVNHQKHATEIVQKLEAKNATLKRRVVEVTRLQSGGVNWGLLHEEGK